MVARGSAPGAHPLRWFATELGVRVVSSLVLAALAIFATWQGGWLFALFWLCGAVAVLVEWLAMTRVEPRLPIQVGLASALAALTTLYVAGAGLTLMLLIAAMAALLAAGQARGLRDRLWALAGFAYAAILCLAPPLVRDHPELGLVSVLWMFAVVWTTDVAAYFAGRQFGGPKLWPQISPKKTWSGFIGGLLVGTLSGLVVALVAIRFGWSPPTSLLVVGLLSALASVASQAGDLGESALKRHFDVKDSGRLIPGHGGMMDRLDGFWAVAALLGLVLVADRLRPLGA